MPPNYFAFVLDGKLAAVLSNDRKIRIWDVAAEKELHHFDVKTAGPAGGQFFAHLFFAGDNRTLLAYCTADARPRRWDALTGKEMGETKGATLPFGLAGLLAGDGWGTLFFQGTTTNLIEVATGKPRQTSSCRRCRRPPAVRHAIHLITAAALAPDGRTLPGHGRWHAALLGHRLGASC